MRVAGARTPVSAIFLDERGTRTIATYRDCRLDQVRPEAPEVLLAGIDAVLADTVSRISSLRSAAPRAASRW